MHTHTRRERESERVVVKMFQKTGSVHEKDTHFVADFLVVYG